MIKDSRLKTKHSRLLIISHTEHFLDAAGRPSGWTPTVREIDFLAGHFKEIIHIAVLHKGEKPLSTAAYEAKNVKFVAIPPFGGPGLKGKLSIFWVMPIVLFKIAESLPKVDIFQFRAPTSIGLAIIPFLTLFSRKEGWYKYAGSWVQPNMPFSYKLQKWMLEKVQRRPVTINGQWPGQPKHVHTFENPCLSEAELPNYQAQGLARKVEMPYTACFVGRLDEAKGVHRIVDLLVSPGIENTIGTFHFVGSGPKLETFKSQLQSSKVKITFHGFCSRDEAFIIYAQSHLFLLPSDSEGFPKVVAEAAAFGCVPIVSDVSSIGQYITDQEGYLWKLQKDSFSDFVLGLPLAPEVVAKQSRQCFALAQKFTFETYLSKLTSSILSSGRN